MNALPSLKNPLIRTLGRWLLPLLLSATSQASLLEDGYRASYQVSRNGMQLGENQRSLQPLPDGRLQLQSRIRPTGVAKLFVRDIIDESSRLELTDSGVRPHRYDYHRHGGRKDKRYGLRLDWQNDTLHFTHSQLDGPLPADTQDPLSFLVQIMYRLQQGERDFPLAIADRKNVDRFRVSVIDEAPRKTPLGTQPVLRLNIDAEDGGDHYELWTLPATEHLPLRLSRNKDGEQLELRLRTFSPLNTGARMTVSLPSKG